MVIPMKMRKRLSDVVVGLICLLLGSCQSGHLSRSHAKSQLENIFIQQQTPQIPDQHHPLITHIGTVSGNCSDLPEYDPVQYSKEDAVLSATGYITLRPIKKGVWDVELTQLGNQALGAKYGHTQKVDCDAWQVEFVLSKFDHLDVTGIVEDGVHAKVDTIMTFRITPVGLAVRKQTSAIIFDIDERQFGEQFAQKFLSSGIKALLDDEVANTPPDKTIYLKRDSFAFEKYDDGWKATGEFKGN